MKEKAGGQSKFHHKKSIDVTWDGYSNDQKTSICDKQQDMAKSLSTDFILRQTTFPTCTFVYKLLQ